MFSPTACGRVARSASNSDVKTIDALSGVTVARPLIRNCALFVANKTRSRLNCTPYTIRLSPSVAVDRMLIGSVSKPAVAVCLNRFSYSSVLDICA